MGLFDQFVAPLKMPLVESYFVLVFEVAVGNLLLKIWQKVVQVILIYRVCALLIHKNAHSFSVFLQVQVVYCDFFFTGTNCVPICVSSSSLSLPCAWSVFILQLLMLYNYLWLNQQVCYFMHCKIFLELLAVQCSWHDNQLQVSAWRLH